MKRVLVKLLHVMVPRTFSRDSQGVDALRDWDLWGPLIICLLLSVFLFIGTASQGLTEQQQAQIFAASFVIVWAGAGVITLNSYLLGGTLGFFQSVCILGYCVFPLMVAAFLCLLWGNLIFRGVTVIVAFIWGVAACIGFFAGVVPEGRKALATYPVFLFFLVIGWMVILTTKPAEIPTPAPTPAPIPSPTPTLLL
uniref:Protein YIPF n=1 Tax=Arcella intermedia TaxID=1963864 RepID=A0A6B2LIX6_9EUKA